MKKIKQTTINLLEILNTFIWDQIDSFEAVAYPIRLWIFNNIHEPLRWFCLNVTESLTEAFMNDTEKIEKWELLILNKKSDTREYQKYVKRYKFLHGELLRPDHYYKTEKGRKLVQSEHGYNARKMEEFLIRTRIPFDREQLVEVSKIKFNRDMI